MIKNIREKLNKQKQKREWNKDLENAMGQNRHTRRALGKINGNIIIPSNKNIKFNQL